MLEEKKGNAFFERNSWYHRIKVLQPDGTTKYGKKGGFLSREEFEITNVYGSSYLATGLEYWTLTQHNNEENYVIGYMLGNKKLTDKTDIRATNYVKNETKVAGSGTKK